MIYNIAHASLEREKRKVTAELRDYFVDKTLQERGWALVSTLRQSMQQQQFSRKEARRIVRFLKTSFAIRPAHFEYSRSLTGGQGPATSVLPVQSSFRGQQDSADFYQDYLRLQTAVQDKLLSYGDACVLVEDALTAYPNAENWLAG